jgi:electron transport complex protein RnfB
MDLFLPVFIVGSIGFFFGLGLSIASKRLHISSDPRIPEINGVLPGLNCGACGFSSCVEFAKAVAEGKSEPSRCIPGGPKTIHAIADILCVNATPAEPMMAVVHCRGGNAESARKAHYDGIADCNAAVLAGNGSRICSDGCLGLGTCVRACPFGAISINENEVAVVDPDKCTGCELCVKSCPRNIISMIPIVHKIFVACSNHERGVKVKKYCSAGCTSCTLCVKATPSGAISMEENIPVLDYAGNENFISAAYKCPSKCFVDLIKVRPKANIDTKCDGCGECILECPVPNAIKGQIGARHVIDKEKCIGCGLCLNRCHTHAISLWGGIGYNTEKKRRQY